MNSESSVRLGLMPPLSGVVELYGQEICRAAHIACQEVNESGGILGRPLELVIEDDGSLPDSAVRAAEKLIDNHCAAIIGNLLSNSRIAVAYRVAEPRRIPYLNFSFYEGSILSRYFFHFAALPNQQIDRMIPSMRRRFGPRMFFAGNNYEWPRGSIDAAKRSLAAVGGEVVGELYYPIGTSRADLQQLLETVERAGTDVFVPYFAGQDQINLLTLFTEMGLKGRIAVVMGHYDEMMASKLPSQVREGFYSSNTYFMTINSAENRSYLQRLAAMEGVTGIWPNGNGILTNFGEGAYLCVKAFAAAANAAGSIEAETLIKALETIRLKGPQGLVEMHAATHHAKVNTYLSCCEADGTFPIIEHWAAIPPEIPKRYSHMRIQGTSPLDIQIQARIVQNMNECVCLINSTDGAIIYCNAACEEMFGYTVDFLQGKNIKILLDGNRPEASRAFEQVNSNLYQKGVWTGELDLCRNTGEEICCAVSISAFTHAQHGEVWMAVFQDSTERRKQNELLRKAKEVAEQANAAKSLFLAAMSHEIRTPLNAIIGMSEVMGLTPLSLDQRNYISIIQRAGESLLSLINDLLDLSRAEQHGYTILHEPFQALQVFEDCIHIMAPKAREKNLELLYEISEDTIPPLQGDSLRLRQILFNLIGNAIKFTDQGGVFVKVTLEAVKDEWLPLVIEVSDTGIGIPKEFQSIIFDPFSQASHALTERRGGAGLGLSIVKKLTEAMGGTISFQSVQGQGTTFVIHLKMQIAKPEPSPVLVRREWEGAFLGKRAILAMKSPQAQRLLENILQSVGVLVKILPWVEDPGEALLHAEYTTYDFVIWEVEKGSCPPPLKSVILDRPKDGRSHPPVFVLVSNQQFLDLEFDSASDVIKLVKPISKLNFLDELWSKEIKSKPCAAPKPAGTDRPKACIEHPRGSVLIVDDNPENRFLLEAILSGINFKTDTAEDGIQAIEKVKQSSFDVIIMDIQMPRMDGYEATMAIRCLEAEEKRQPAVIFSMTAYSKYEDKGRALLAGANAHMTKPIKRSALIEVLDQYLTRPQN